MMFLTQMLSHWTKFSSIKVQGSLTCGRLFRSTFIKLEELIELLFETL